MSLVARFLGWWGRELAALVPGPLRRLVAPRRPLLVMRLAEDGIRLETRGRRGARPLGALEALSRKRRARLLAEIARGRLTPVLAVPRARVVSREVSLPLAAEEDVAGVLRYEIDRLTPFSAGELYYDHRVVARRAEAGRIDLALVFAPRADLEPLVDGLAAEGLAPARLDVEDAPGEGAEPPALAGLDLLPPRPRAAPSRAAALAGGLAALLAVLALGWAGTSLLAAEARVDALRERLDEVRRAAIRAADAAPATGQGAARLAYEMKRAAAPAVVVVADVTEILPDHTWLDRLSLKGDRVELSGYSRNASALIGRFDRHPRFADPLFRAPIVQDDASGRERFLLSVRVVPAEEGG